MLLSILACTMDGVTVFVEPLYQDNIDFFISSIEDERLSITVSDDPSKSLKRHRGIGIALINSQDGEKDAYRLSNVDGKSEWVVEGDMLGLQYGLADMLEKFNYRFYHPYKSYIPNELDSRGIAVETEWQAPDMQRRGLHLHTLHPIEGYYDFWEPSEQSLYRAKRVVDWMIKNRGNYIEWVALDNIAENPIAYDAWQLHTKDIVDNIHQRGATVGIGVQLFGSGNLQNAYDLIDEPDGNRETQINSRVGLILDQIEFDVLEMSFGEFFEEDPQEFIDSINQAYDIIQQISPGIEMTARLHVGDDLKVTYNDEEMIYYFLAAYANSEITPWVHTVMYYNLFEPSNGTYHHEDFSEHRDFLFKQLEEGLPVGYFPESAYWVAFDNSVPVYLPMYVRSRWLDMVEIEKSAIANEHDVLTDHTLFSSGWEFGYWQNDVTTLRMNWSLPDSYITVFEDLFSNYSNGKELATALYEFSEIQKVAMIDDRLDAYTCGVDNIMELGYSQDIISQPVRLSFRQMLEVELIELQSIQTSLTKYLSAIESISFPDATDVWQREIADGVLLDTYRAEYMEQLVHSIIAHRSNTDPTPYLSQAQEVFTLAQEVIERRRNQALDPESSRLFEQNSNHTIYQFGYLYRASDLCYWQREMIQASNAIEGTNIAPPGCGL